MNRSEHLAKDPVAAGFAFVGFAVRLDDGQYVP